MSEIRVFVILRCAPDKAINAHGSHIGRIDPTPAKHFDESYSISQAVVFDQVTVGGDDGAEILSKRNVDRRAVVERPNTHCEDVSRRFRRLAREAFD